MRDLFFTCTKLLIIAVTVLSCAEGICLAADRGLRNNQIAITQDDLTPFTVADSISMTHFEVPDENSNSDAPVSPDGAKFLVVTERGILDKNLRDYSLIIYDVAKPEKPIVVKTFSSSSNRPGISEARWLNNRLVTFLGELPGGVPQVYLMDSVNGEERRLTGESLGVVSYAVSNDQKRLVYYNFWGGKEPEDEFKQDHGFAVTNESIFDLVGGGLHHHELISRLHMKDLSTGSIRVGPSVQLSQRIPPIWLSPNGRYAVTEQVPSTVPSDWTSYEDPFVKRYAKEWVAHAGIPNGLSETMLVNIDTGDVRPLVGAPSSVGNSSTTVVWSSDSRLVVVAATLLPLSTQDPQELAKRRARPVIAAINISVGSTQRVLEMPDNALIQIRAGHLPDSFEITGSKADPGGDVTNRIPKRTFHRDGNQWHEDDARAEKHEVPQITVHQSLDRWPVLVKVDHATGQETNILDPNPQFKHFRFGKREVINWTGKLGETLTGGFVYPAEYVQGNRYPLVIQTHGFSAVDFLLDGPFTTAMAAEELANRGIAVLQLPQTGLERATCDRGEATQSQIESAVDYLDHVGLINRNRVGLLGFSITGFNVKHALANSSYQFAAATSAEGNDWGYWTYILWANEGAMASQSECPYGGPPWSNNWDSWMKKSISFHYDKIHTPLRLESDTNDGFSEVLNEWESFIALKRLRKPVELIYITHGSHPVVRPWDRLASQQGNVDWMCFWLKDEEDSDPSKAAQYARWRDLRKLQEEQQKLDQLPK